MWDLSSLTRDWTHAPASEAWSLNHWTAREVPYLVFFNWSIVNLQCCVSFRCTAKWFSYTYIYIYFFRLFSLIGYYKISSIVPCWLSILYIVVCVCSSQAPNLSLPPTTFPLWSPKVCFKNLWVCFCFVNHFLNIPHMSDIIWYLSDLLHLAW